MFKKLLLLLARRPVHSTGWGRPQAIPLFSLRSPVCTNCCLDAVIQQDVVGVFCFYSVEQDLVSRLHILDLPVYLIFLAAAALGLLAAMGLFLATSWWCLPCLSVWWGPLWVIREISKWSSSISLKLPCVMYALLLAWLAFSDKPFNNLASSQAHSINCFECTPDTYEDLCPVSNSILWAS